MNLKYLSLLVLLASTQVMATSVPAGTNNACNVVQVPTIGQFNRPDRQANKASMRKALFLHLIKCGGIAHVLPWLKKGMDPNAADNQGANEWMPLVKSLRFLRLFDSEIKTKEIPALMIGLLRCKEKNNGECIDRDKEAAVPIIRALLNYGANPNAEAEISIDYCNDVFTPLSLATEIGCNSLINDLIDAGADPNGFMNKRSDTSSLRVRSCDKEDEYGMLMYDDNFLYDTPLLIADEHAHGEFAAVLDPGKSARWWLIISKLLHAGATEMEKEAIEKILIRALKLYACMRNENTEVDALHWPALLPSAKESIVPHVRDTLLPFMPSAIIDHIILDYAEGMHPDVEEVIRAKIMSNIWWQALSRGRVRWL